jgi:DNA mismatch repair protein MutS2
MIFSDSFEQKIGFDRIREMLAKECRNSISLALAEELAFSTAYEEVTRSIGLVHEYQKVLNEVYGHPDAAVSDLTTLLDSVRVPGSWFEPEYLPLLKDSLEAIAAYVDFFIANQNTPLLAALTENITIDSSLVPALSSLLNEKGEIRDGATPELAGIRKEIVLARGRSERALRRVLKEAVSSGVLPKDTEYTVKEGRYVIPVPASRKRQIKGYILDESATGQTCYIEPAEVVELLNEIREFEMEERREIIRIMISVADRLRPCLEALSEAFQYAGMLDFIRAKARIANIMGATRPSLVNKPFINWKNAVHPLLFLSHREQHRKTVPLDITLDEHNRILVISGPNAGGKSVCLKTVGLLQYMLQCGMLVPLHDSSVSGMFSGIFVEIGDEQSIENDLSTYSSHLLNLKNLLESAGNGTLFLIDEMGSGTEPESGGAIAEAALETLATSGSMGVVTTHYANLKLLAGSVEGIQNGAMLFDTRNMKPLFVLKTGKPGSSFAFEIAAKSGLSETLLEKARDKVGRARYDLEYQLQNLESEKEELAAKMKEMRVTDAFLAEMIEKYTSLHAKLEASRKEIIQKAKVEAGEILSGANRMIEKTIREIRESDAARDAVRQIRSSLEKETEQLVESPVAPLPVPFRDVAVRMKKKTDSTVKEIRKGKPVEIGDYVKIAGQNSPGQVMRFDKMNAVVAFGNVMITVKAAALEPSPPPEKQPGMSQSVRVATAEYLNKGLSFKPEIDIRGKRAEEALRELRLLVDDAILLNVKDLMVLHGKGDGILRQVVRDYLAGVPEISSYKDEHVDRGGHGITLIRLK